MRLLLWLLGLLGALAFVACSSGDIELEATIAAQNLKLAELQATLAAPTSTPLPTGTLAPNMPAELERFIAEAETILKKDSDATFKADDARRSANPFAAVRQQATLSSKADAIIQIGQVRDQVRALETQVQALVAPGDPRAQWIKERIQMAVLLRNEWFRTLLACVELTPKDGVELQARVERGESGLWLPVCNDHVRIGGDILALRDSARYALVDIKADYR